MSGLPLPTAANTYELGPVGRDSDENTRVDSDYLDNENDEVQASLLHEQHSAYPALQPLWKQRLANFLPFSRLRQRHHLFVGQRVSSTRRPAHSWRILKVTCTLLLATIFATALLFPSYTHPPLRYAALKKRIESSDGQGLGNPDNQKIFIAASIFDPDGDLAAGKWGDCILSLVHILGPDNVYLSIYGNDAGKQAEQALAALQGKIQCGHTLRFDEHLGLDEVEHVSVPDGSDRVKRITYLAEARNRALLPLIESKTKYHKLLYLNDVVFDPTEIAQLLFLTGTDDQGSTSSYRAACAVDFINPVKFYDTFATRDEEGYGIGLPFFPWFTTAGQGKSRKHVLSGSDAIPVRSCWGGAVAFDARFFQDQIGDAENDLPTAASQGPANKSAPYAFRAEDDLFWDASECCLIHADIQDPDQSKPSGIVMNPYVRTAYDANTLKWLRFSRRFERLYTPIHWIISTAVGMPWYNPRRDEKPWSEVREYVWTGNKFELVDRIAGHSGFCGRRGLQLMKMDRSGGGKTWEPYPIPAF